MADKEDRAASRLAEVEQDLRSVEIDLAVAEERAADLENALEHLLDAITGAVPEVSRIWTLDTLAEGLAAAFVSQPDLARAMLHAYSPHNIPNGKARVA